MYAASVSDSNCGLVMFIYTHTRILVSDCVRHLWRRFMMFVSGHLRRIYGTNVVVSVSNGSGNLSPTLKLRTRCSPCPSSSSRFDYWGPKGRAKLKEWKEKKRKEKAKAKAQRGVHISTRHACSVQENVGRVGPYVDRACLTKTLTARTRPKPAFLFLLRTVLCRQGTKQVKTKQ